MLKFTVNFFLCVSIFLLCQHNLFGMDRRLVQSLQQRMQNMFRLRAQLIDVEQQLKKLNQARSCDECCRVGMMLAGECCMYLPEFETPFERAIDWVARLGLCSFICRESNLYYQELLKKTRQVAELMTCKDNLERALKKYK